jgi:hypothetical protein
MTSCQAVLLTPSKCAVLGPLPFYKQISPFFAALTNHSQLTENTTTLSLFLATLTDSAPVSPVFATHTKTWGGGGRFFSFWFTQLAQSLEGSPPRLAKSHSALRERKSMGRGGYSRLQLRGTAKPASYGIRKILCSFKFRLLHNFCSSFNAPLPHRARNGSKHSSRDCSALCGYSSDSRKLS